MIAFIAARKAAHWLWVVGIEDELRWLDQTCLFLHVTDPIYLYRRGDGGELTT